MIHLDKIFAFPHVGLLIACIIFSVPRASSWAQENQPPKYEFRGAWIATVNGLDWPKTNDSSQQKKRMIRILDVLKNARINAVFFQVRSIGDAMYASSYEPWSHLLTGDQAKAPDYDPLEYIIQEAHRRGMELHAWINPYRIHIGDRFKVADNHLTVTHPEWAYSAGRYKYLDPGKEDVRDHISVIVMDIARRYDIDGIHFDDYFYPYPPDHIGPTQQDIQTFRDDSRGFTNINDWRRDNINMQIAQISDSLRSFNPGLKFGISPFGIWKRGVPSGIVGLNAYDVIFADATAWIKSQTIDYLVPQLYWKLGGPQDYAKLARWWEAQSEERHLYTGHALYKSASRQFSTSEVPNQIRFNRNHSGILGSSFFRATLPPWERFSETMRNGLYKYPALTPPMDWKDQTPPAAPFNLMVQTDEASILLRWEVPESIAPGRYAVYRVKSDTEPDANDAAQDPLNLIALTGEIQFRDTPHATLGKYWYFVRSVSRNSVESEPSNIVESPAFITSVTKPDRGPLKITAYPTLFDQHLQIEYSLETAGTVRLEVFDVMGRSVATLIEGISSPPGQYRFSLFSSEHPLPSGAYWLVLSGGNHRVTQAIIHRR